VDLSLLHTHLPQTFKRHHVHGCFFEAFSVSVLSSLSTLCLLDMDHGSDINQCLDMQLGASVLMPLYGFVVPFMLGFLASLDIIVLRCVRTHTHTSTHTHTHGCPISCGCIMDVYLDAFATPHTRLDAAGNSIPHVACPCPCSRLLLGSPFFMACLPAGMAGGGAAVGASLRLTAGLSIRYNVRRGRIQTRYAICWRHL